MRLELTELTRELNQFRLSEECLPISEFRAKIRKYVSYSTFSSLLLEEGFGDLIGNLVYLSRNPIHTAKVEKILKTARNRQYQYNKETQRKKYEEELRVDDVVQYLKEKGYIIIKPVEML